MITLLEIYCKWYVELDRDDDAQRALRLTMVVLGLSRYFKYEFLYYGGFVDKIKLLDFAALIPKVKNLIFE